ncbi:LysR family transcriptional regulator [Microvirga puerhi]|uniref:LysR family transcriptional regulator n=1 Tax=Microvirga puerhi TaxID=2876078 RepID=A0ABS7VW82_9HYPH|nr:LysR family transcriptional regulator [Microvirga puerhi]MBZ6079320.1 LysR family transcriptional regulator [Microvirga puerhi]
MTLSLRHIEIFHAVMASGGATQAAALLRTSQPTVSRELKDLERTLGFPLFLRKGRYLLPTEAALSLHTEVRRSFAGLEEISRAAEAIRANASVHLSIACQAAYSTTLLPGICQDFLKVNPSTRLRIRTSEQAVIVNWLTNHRYDLGIIEADPRLEGPAGQTVEVGEELCIIPKGHFLADKKVLEPKDFEDLDFIYFSAEDAYRRNIDAVFHAHRVRRRLRVEASTASCVCSMVAQGLGVSLVNPISAIYHRGEGIELRRFSVRIPYLVGLYGPADGERSDLSNQFLQTCADALERIKKDLARVT